MKATIQILKLTVICALLVLAPAYLAKAQDSSGTVVSVVPSQNAVQVEQILTVNVTASNVQNLFGLDVTVHWNNSALQIISINDLLGVETYPGGVLHETGLYPIKIAVSETSQEIGQHHIVATSQGDAASFYGSGTIATLTFNVTATGHSEITVVSELADHPTPDEATSELIPHNNINASVDAAQIPEFPQISFLAVLAVAATITLVFGKKALKKKTSL
jgi:hypothetical protein